MEARQETLAGSPSGGSELVIVSAYGRGNWLASELAGRGWSVTLADVTESLGPCEPADAEGPFGLFAETDLFPKQRRWFIDEGGAVRARAGFTLWLKDGPIEFSSSATDVHLRKLAGSEAVASYIDASAVPSKDSERQRKNLSKLAFREAWPAHFAHQLASPVMEENHRALTSGRASPLFAGLWFRQASRSMWQKGLENCHASGVKVRTRASVRDIRLSGRFVDAIEIADERAGVERGKSFVWMLSSTETAQGSRALFETLYPNGALEPEWYWTRYTLTLGGSTKDDALPAHAVLIEEPFLPWTHTNFMIMARRYDERQFDIWLRLPVRRRFDVGYLKECGEQIERTLRERIPVLEPKITALPLETHFDEKKLGAPKFPIFDAGRLCEFTPLRAPNFFFGGVEHCESLDWLGLYRQQNEILLKLEKLKAQWVAAARKEASREARSPSP